MFFFNITFNTNFTVHLFFKILIEVFLIQINSSLINEREKNFNQIIESKNQKGNT